MKHSLIPLFLVTILSGCCTTVDHTIGTPARPELIPLTAEQIGQIPVDVLDVVVVNDLALKQYAKKLETRIELHDQK